MILNSSVLWELRILYKEKQLLLEDFSKWVSNLSWLPETIGLLLDLLRKRRKVKVFPAWKAYVIMLGDGINNSPGLAAADVNMAIGAATDIAMEVVGYVLMKSN